jgi:hypothetical protein
MEKRLIIRQQFWVDVKIFERKKDAISKAKRQANAAKNFQKTQHAKGFITKNGMKNLRSAAEAYLLAIFYKRADNARLGIRQASYPTFITLTYPAVNQLDDEYCKKNHLSPFISYLTRTKKCAGYVWRAEVQKNGNLHFHLFTDKFIPHTWIREIWNNIIEADNFITEFEKAHNHRNPNSTDIEAVKNLEKAAKYLAKYITKAEKFATRPINGRVYGMSDNIRTTATHYALSDWDREEFLDAANPILVEAQILTINDFAAIIKPKRATRQTLYEVGSWYLGDYAKHYVSVANNLCIK